MHFATFWALEIFEFKKYNTEALTLTKLRIFCKTNFPGQHFNFFSMKNIVYGLWETQTDKFNDLKP